MDALHERILRAVEADRIVFTLHADNQLAVRGVRRWQAIAGVADAELVSSHSSARPNPKVVLRQLLPDGTAVIAVWAFVRSIESASLVTLYFEEDQ